MAGKQLYNQRRIFKIHSSRLVEANWDLTISRQEGYDNEEIVSLGDSQLLGFIRVVNGKKISLSYEEQIRDIKKQIKKELKERTKDNLKEKSEIIKKLNKQYEDMIFEEDYLSIEFENKKDFKRACKGFKFNGKEYVRLLGTTGGVKNNVVNFINKAIEPQIREKLNCGRDSNFKLIPAKFEAYTALSASASTPVTTPKILIIQDGAYTVKDKVIKISDDGNGGFKVDKNIDYIAEDKEFCDGCGMMLPNYSEQLGIDLHLGYAPSGVNTRYAFNKGMICTFDFLEFAEKEMNGKYIVKDAWGVERDLRDYNVILTTNMVKLWKAYKSLEHYCECCEKYGYQFRVAKVTPKELEDKRNSNYQYLQSFERMTDKDIEDFCRETVEDIKGVLGENAGKALLFARGEKVRSKEDLDSTEQDWVRALAINGEMINDPYVKQKLYKMIEKKINDAKKGTIQIDGNYCIICGDLYALCQTMYGLEPTGLLGYGEFYSQYWMDKGRKEVLFFRSPMTSHNNIVKAKITYDDKAKYWFRYLKTMTVFNNKDLSTESLNGCDFDSDALVETDNPTLMKRYEKMLPIICEQSSSEKVKVTEGKLAKSNSDGFGNDVGAITNKVTAMFDVLASFEKGSPEYNEVENRILCGQAYQQESIDKIKGIKAKTMPKEWFDYKATKLNIDYETGEILDDEETVKHKEFLQRTMVNKKPYFFIYNYPQLYKEYRSHIKGVQDECLLTFRKSFEELQNQETFTEEELNFLDRVKKYSPVFKNPCVMNKICWYIEDTFKDVKLKVRDDSEFDTKLLKTRWKPKQKPTKEVYDNIEQLYKEYKQQIIDFNSDKKRHADKEDNTIRLQMFEEQIRTKAIEICPDEEALCNIVIDLCYDKKKDKKFAWVVSREQILTNLFNKSGNCYNYPIEDENGDIEWKGKKYSIQPIKEDI